MQAGPVFGHGKTDSAEFATSLSAGRTNLEAEESVVSLEAAQSASKNSCVRVVAGHWSLWNLCERVEDVGRCNKGFSI